MMQVQVDNYSCRLTGAASINPGNRFFSQNWLEKRLGNGCIVVMAKEGEVMWKWFW